MADFIQNGGSNGGTYARYFSGILSVWENSYDIGSNTSNIGYRLQLNSGSSGRFSGLTANYNININGTIVNSGSGTYSSQNYNTSQSICEGSITVAHNDDGSKTINCSAVLEFQSHSYSPGNFYPSGNLTLTTIPRASGVGATSAYIEENTIISINRASSNFRHTLTCAFCGTTETIAEKTSNTTISWTLPSSFYRLIPNQKTSWATINCITYNGNTEIGRSSCTFTVNTNEEKCKPSLEATIEDINETTINLTGDSSKLVKHKSTAKVTITTNAKNSASIKNKKVNNVIISDDNVSIQNIETDTFVITVTDSRGYSSSVTLNPIVINYIPLTINAMIKRRQPTTGEVEITFSGNYFNDNFGDESNFLTVNWYYREKGSNNWILGGELPTVINNNKYGNENSSISLGKHFDYQKAYEFYLEAIDKLTILQSTYSITEGIPIFNWGKDFININGDFRINELSFLPVVLYENEEGKTGTITLSESTENFSYLEIFYVDNSNNNNTSTKVTNPNGKTVALLIIQSSNGIYLRGKEVSISGDSITVNNSSYCAISTNNELKDYSSTDYIKIVKVIGYR